jgi:hypothetical protein
MNMFLKEGKYIFIGHVDLCVTTKSKTLVSFTRVFSLVRIRHGTATGPKANNTCIQNSEF